MFSKSRIHEPGPKQQPATPDAGRAPAVGRGADESATSARPGTPKPKAPPSSLSSDLTITGDIKTTGDIQVEGNVKGDIRAHLLIVGEGATIRGEVMADDVVVNGRVIGRVRGLKVRLTSTSKVEGDIIHKTIAIESGAHFEGSVQRHDDPLSGAGKARPPQASKPQAQAPKPASAPGSGK